MDSSIALPSPSFFSAEYPKNPINSKEGGPFQSISTNTRGSNKRIQQMDVESQGDLRASSNRSRSFLTCGMSKSVCLMSCIGVTLLIAVTVPIAIGLTRKHTQRYHR